MLVPFSLMSWFVRFFLLLVLYALPVIACARPGSENDSLPSQKQWIIGVFEYPPFIIKEDNGNWTGISVQLWRKVADELQLKFQFKEIPPDSAIQLVTQGTLDAAICCTATSKDEQRVDFSQIYYSTGMGVAGSKMQSLSSIARGIFTMRFFQIVIWISILMLIIGVLIWAVERKSNESHFGGERNSLQGIGAGFWWAGVTMTTIGYGDKAPVTFFGRTLALLWMLLAMAITSSLTASIVAAVGVGRSGTLHVPEDLRGMKVGSIEGTNSAAYLKQERIHFVNFNSADEGIEALEEGTIEAFVDSAPVLRYLVNENASLTSKVEDTDVNPQNFAVALPQGSRDLEQINRSILKNINSDKWNSLLNRYIPRD